MAIKISIGEAEAARISLANWILKKDPHALLRASEIARHIAESRKLKLDWSCQEKTIRAVSKIEEYGELLRRARDGLSYGDFPDGTWGGVDSIGYEEYLRAELSKTKTEFQISATDLAQNNYKSFETTEIMDEDMRRLMRKMTGLMKEPTIRSSL